MFERPNSSIDYHWGNGVCPKSGEFVLGHADFQNMSTVPLFVVTLVESKTGAAVKKSGRATCLADGAKRRQCLPTLTAFRTKPWKGCYSLIDAVRTLAEACKAFASASLVALVIETYTQFFYMRQNMSCTIRS